MHVNIIARDRIPQTSTTDLRHALDQVRLSIEHNRDPECRRLLAEEGLRYQRELATRRPTPYEQHAQAGHAPMARHSPNGVDIVEECDCGMRWLHNPAIGYPVTLH